jgi:hypothetical protein
LGLAHLGEVLRDAGQQPFPIEGADQQLRFLFLCRNRSLSVSRGFRTDHSKRYLSIYQKFIRYRASTNQVRRTPYPRSSSLHGEGYSASEEA